jgi:hypothetical protein
LINFNSSHTAPFSPELNAILQTHCAGTLTNCKPVLRLRDDRPAPLKQ